MTRDMRGETPRRGAPRPLHEHEVVPPDYLTPEQRQCFMEAASSRPGYWTSADLISLEAYSVAAAFVRAAHRATAVGEEFCTPKAYRSAIGTMLLIGRSLRVTAQGRADERGLVAPPVRGPNDPGAGTPMLVDPRIRHPWNTEHAGH